METFLSYLARTIVASARCLPFALAWVSRRLGGLAWILDKRHRTVARKNLAAAFPEKSQHDVTQLARHHFQRLGETYAIPKTGGMNAEQIKDILTFEGYERLESVLQEDLKHESFSPSARAELRTSLDSLAPPPRSPPPPTERSVNHA